MKPVLVLSCMLFLGAVASAANATTDIPFWHHHKKDAVTTSTAPKPKAKRNLLHRAAATRQESARSEATYGMTGPRSVGHFHPQPGPAGVGAK